MVPLCPALGPILVLFGSTRAHSGPTLDLFGFASGPMAHDGGLLRAHGGGPVFGPLMVHSGPCLGFVGPNNGGGTNIDRDSWPLRNK